MAMGASMPSSIDALSRSINGLSGSGSGSGLGSRTPSVPIMDVSKRDVALTVSMIWSSTHANSLAPLC